MFLLAALIYMGNAGAQWYDTSAFNHLPPRMQDEAMAYVQQANNAKITAWGLCIGGAVLACIGSVMINESELKYGVDIYNQDNKDDIGAVLVLAGITSAGISIPFFIKVHRKREKVRGMISENRKAYIVPGLSPVSQRAGIKIVIPL